MRRYILSVILVLVLMLGGCSKSEPVKSSTPPFQKINYSLNVKDILTFTTASNAELYMLEKDGVLRRYQNDGKLIKEYKDMQDVTAMCWSNDVLYTYDAVKNQIDSLNTKSGKKKSIVKNFKLDEVLKLVTVQNDIYVLTVPKLHADAKPGSNGYIDYGEKLYKVDTASGKVTQTKEDNIIALYGASNGELYYYAYRDDTYALYRYNTENGKSKKQYNMMNTGYISAFIYEKDYFVCAVTGEKTVKVIKPSEGSVKKIEDKLLVLSGNDMVCERGNVLYYGMKDSKAANTVNTLYLGDITFTKADGKQKASSSSDTSNNTESQTEDSNTVVISTPFRTSHNTSAVESICGINARMVDQSTDQQALLTEIMSGNSDVDIYITVFGSDDANGIRDKRIYVPLNDSKIINSYKNQCFDYVANAMKADNGDIWMVPFATDYDAIWYVPENAAKFSVKPEDFRYFDSFFSMSERLPKTGSYAAYVNFPGNLGYEFHDQYDRTYNDFMKKEVNYETELYKHIFDKMWTGWVKNSQNPKHPAFRRFMDENAGDMNAKSAFYDKSKIIYKVDTIYDQLNISEDSLKGWRVLPQPRISDKAKGNNINLTCAYINPYSKHKELAMKYLEAITKVPFDFDIYCLPLLFKEKKMYADHFDTKEPAFDDIYRILEDGVLNPVSSQLNGTIIDDYQNGRLTLDEAIAAVQREAKMWLNE